MLQLLIFSLCRVHVRRFARLQVDQRQRSSLQKGGETESASGVSGFPEGTYYPHTLVFTSNNLKIDNVTCRDGQWWVAKSLVTGLEGFIPCNYVARADTLEEEK